MLDRPTPIVSDRVTDIVSRFLVSRSITAPVSVEQDLQAAGLSSLDVVALMLTVEAAFDLTISGADLIPANFHSIAAIQALIRKLLARP